MRHRKLVRLAAVVMALGLIAAGCRGDDDDAGGTNGGGNGGGNGGDQAQEVRPGPGFDGTTITVTALTPQTGIAAVIGNPLTRGNEVFFQALNAQGGIAGRYPVRVAVADTRYEAPTAVQQYQATKGSTAAYVQVLGTAVVDAVLPQLGTDDVLAGPASLDAFWVREPNLMPIGAPYQVQIINGMDYAVRELDAADRTICALTKDDPYGETGLAGLEFAAEEMDFEIAARATFRQTDQNFTAPISQLREAGCQITILTALPNETSPILTEAVAQSFAPTWIANSPTWVTAFAASALAPYLEENFLLLSEGPEWGDTSIPGMAQMLEDLEAYAPDQAPDIYFAFGYAQAWALAQILEKAVEEGDLSPAGIVEASTRVRTLTFDDLVGDYQYGTAEDRNPPRATTVFAVDPAGPGGLRALETNFTSSPAEDYEFE